MKNQHNIVHINKYLELKNRPCVRCRYAESRESFDNCKYVKELQQAIENNSDLPKICDYQEAYKDMNGYTPDDHQFFRTCDVPVDSKFLPEYRKYWTLNPLNHEYWHNMTTIKISEAISLLLNVDPNHMYDKVNHWLYIEILTIVFSHFKASRFKLTPTHVLTNYTGAQGIFENALIDMKVFFEWSQTLTIHTITNPNFLYCCINNVGIENVLLKTHKKDKQLNIKETTAERNTRWQNRANQLSVEKPGITRKMATEIIYKEERKNGYKGNFNTILRHIDKDKMSRV